MRNVLAIAIFLALLAVLPMASPQKVISSSSDYDYSGANESFSNVESSEQLEGEEADIYTLRREEEVRILNVIRVTMPVTARIDLRTGETIEVRRPWWSFLVLGGSTGLSQEDCSLLKCPNAYFNSTTNSCACGAFNHDSPCLQGQMLHQGVCKPTFIELNDDYSNPEAYILGHMAGDPVGYNFSYPPLVAKANELASGKESDMEKVLAISNWVYNSKYYMTGADENGGLQTLWNNEYGVCNHAARITVALLSNAGIPSIFHFVQYEDVAHASTIFNVDGLWGAVDTTFHKGSMDDPDREVYMQSAEAMRKRVYITIDEEGRSLSEASGQYCNIKSMVCSSHPFASLKIFMHPSIPAADIYYPAEDRIVIPEYASGPTRYSFHCGMRINGMSCTGQGCGFDEADPDYGTIYEKFVRGNKYNPEFGDNLLPMDYRISYLADGEPFTKIGYVHMRMPSSGGLSYYYRCVDLSDSSLIATSSGDIDSSGAIVVEWDKLVRSPSASQEKFDALTDHFRQLTDELGIRP